MTHINHFDAYYLARQSEQLLIFPSSEPSFLLALFICINPTALFICYQIIINFNLMKQRLRATANRIQHITHQLNNSTAKIAHSFRWGERFAVNKSVSPDVFYDLPSSLGKRSCSFGIGHRRSLEKVDCTEPARYRIPSQFDVKKQDGGRGAFGIGREEFYKGKTQKNPLGPGTYNLKDPIDSKRFYMGRKVQSVKNKLDLSSGSYKLKGQSKLNTSRNNDSSLKMKTQYISKNYMSAHDNKVLEPGSYTQRSSLINSGSYSQQRKKMHSFGDTERNKKPKPSHLGPGSYNIFSQFGNNL